MLAYKVGANTPYLRIPRAFIRQVLSRGSSEEMLNWNALRLASQNGDRSDVFLVRRKS